MTVEQLIERLQYEYRHSPVLIQVASSDAVPSWRRRGACSLLRPCRIRTRSTDGAIMIVCERHDC